MSDNQRKTRAILARLSEPSTWAGLAALAAVLGANITPAGAEGIVQGGAALASVLAMLLPEKGGQ